MKHVLGVALLAVLVTGCSPALVKQESAPSVPVRNFAFKRVNGNLPTQAQIAAELARTIEGTGWKGKSTASADGSNVELVLPFRDANIGYAYAADCLAAASIRSSITGDMNRTSLSLQPQIRVVQRKAADWQKNSLAALAVSAAELSGAVASDEQRLAAAVAACRDELVKVWPATAQLSFSYMDEFSGEINSLYPDDAVYANFERLLPKATWSGPSKTEIEKTKAFKLDAGGILASVAIAVYPYQRGSKLVYTVRYPYAVFGDGRTSYRAGAVEQLRRRIAAIANN